MRLIVGLLEKTVSKPQHRTENGIRISETKELRIFLDLYAKRKWSIQKNMDRIKKDERVKIC